MVAKLPEQRFQTMSEVVSQLEHCLAMLPPTPRFDGSHQGRHHAHGSQASTLSNPSPVLGTVSAPPATHPPLQQGDICLPREGDTEPHTNRAETSPNLVISPRSPAGPRLRRRGRNYYLALGGGIAALLAGIVVLIPTKDGTIRVEIGDPQIEVNVKGTDIVLGKADSTHDIALSPGEKTLIVKRGDFVFETDDFTLKKGETAAVRVQLLDGQVEVHQGDQLLGKEKLPLPQPPAEPAEVENAAATESPPLTIAMAPFNATQAKRHQQAWAEHLGIPVEQAIKLAEGVELPLVLIPPGEFLMGSTDEQIEAALRLARKPQESSGIVDSVRDAQRPQHRVRLTRPFLIGATEVTIGQFKAFSKATGHVTLAEAHRAAAEARRDPRLPFVFRTYVDPGFPVTDDHPASQVTWEDANAFCDWLNHQAAKQLGNDLTITFRLPTEAEWEYACRAGTDTLYSFGDNARHLDQYGWYDCKGSLPVATRRPNAFGLYDMHGNVSEWCNDWFDPIWYEVSPTVDPVGPEIGKQRVLRGGSWWACRQVANISAMRRGLPARYTYNISWWGFRVAATLSPRSVEMQSGQVPRPPQENAKLAQVSEDQQAFIDRVARLPAEQQAAAVAEKLQEVNPGFDGVVTHRIADGKVVEYGLSTARVRNIWPLSALTDLEALEITGFRGDTQVGWVIDLEPLAGLPLQSLNCSHNRELRDLTPLKGMQLTTLSILGTSVTDLSPLAGMPLTRLECGYTNITDLRPLQGMPLSELVCMHTPISDLSPLGGMELRHLNIAGCRKITDFSQLTDLSVSILAISNTAIADLSPLRKMPLTRLFCDDTPVADLSPLKDIPLHTLSITGTAVTDLSPIKDIPLTQLNFDIVPERDVELLRAMKPLSVINMRPAKEFWQSIEPARPR